MEMAWPAREEIRGLILEMDAWMARKFRTGDVGRCS